jgi:hypothetical protein
MSLEDTLNDEKGREERATRNSQLLETGIKAANIFFLNIPCLMFKTIGSKRILSIEFSRSPAGRRADVYR